MKKLALALSLFLSSCTSLIPGISFEQSKGQAIMTTGSANNIVLQDNIAYASMGNKGIAVIELAQEKVLLDLAPPLKAQSVDDLAIADNLLFALDANPPAFLSVYSLEDPHKPELIGKAEPIDMKVFSGVSAAKGKVVVSGGTQKVLVWTYDQKGQMSQTSADTDLGTGQPDVLLSPDGQTAYVSTHFQGSDYGVTELLLNDPQKPTLKNTLVIEGSGFSAGHEIPANFALESALYGNTLLTAFGGGLALINTDGLKLKQIIHSDLKGVNVDVFGNTAFMVGSAPQAAVVEINLKEGKAVRQINLKGKPTGISANESYIAIAANEAGVLSIPRQALKMPM